MKTNELLFKIVLYADTLEAMEDTLRDQRTLFDKHNCVTVGPRENNNPNVPLEYFAILFVYVKREGF